jgi:hypothetical protein
MTASALVTMISAWTVIILFMARFFLKVIRTPQKMD